MGNKINKEKPELKFSKYHLARYHLIGFLYQVKWKIYTSPLLWIKLKTKYWLWYYKIDEKIKLNIKLKENGFIFRQEKMYDKNVIRTIWYRDNIDNIRIIFSVITRKDVFKAINFLSKMSKIKE